MSVTIIDTLKPKNNGSFPVVEAADVAVAADLRLTEALEAKADAADLANTNAAVSLKADATVTDGLQNQINQIEISATAEAVVAPEVAGARVAADGAVFDTLKERCDADSEKSAETKSELVQLAKDQIIKKEYTLEYGSINNNGTEAADTDPSTTMRTVEYMSVADAVSDGASISIPQSTTVLICYYDSSKTFKVRQTVSSEFEFDQSYTFFRLSFYRGSISGGSDPDLFMTALQWGLYELNNRLTTIESSMTGLAETTSAEIETVSISVDNVSQVVFTPVDTPVKIENITGIEIMQGCNCSAGNDGLRIEELSGYDTYYFIAEKDMELWFDNNVPGGKYVAILHGEDFQGVSHHSGYDTLLSSNAVRKRNTDHNLPTSENKLSVSAGDVVAFTFTAGFSYPVTGYSQGKKMLVESVYSGVYSLNDNSLEITMKKGHFIFKRITDDTINLDTWRLYKGDIVFDNGAMFNMWTGSDAEGVVQIQGEEDFIGGYHGDEVISSIRIFIDGIEIDSESTISEKNFKTISIYVESDIYHCGENTVAFKRNKFIRFENDVVTIGNDWTAQEALTIASAPLTMFQCFYKLNDEETATAYSVNTDFKLYELSDPSTHPSPDKEMTEFRLETKIGAIECANMKTSGQNKMGVIAYNFIESQNRIKYYYYTIYNATEIEQGDRLTSQFSFKIVGD